MKLSFDTKSFASAVDWVTKAFDNKDEKAYVALHVSEDGSGYLSHMNKSSHMRSSVQLLSVDFDGDDVDSVKLALDGAYIKRMVGALADHTSPLVFSKDLSNPKSTLAGSRSGERYTIPLLDIKPTELPAYVELGEVSDGEFFDALQRLAKLTDPINAGMLPVLGTVDIKLDAEAERVVLMATDRYALGEISLDFTPSDGAGEFFAEASNLLLPAERATAISPSKGLVESVTLIHEPKSDKFGYVFGDGRVALFSLSAASPLSYQPIKENSLKTDKSLLVSTQDFKKTLAAISNLAWDEASITLILNEDGVTVTDGKGTNTRHFAAAVAEGIEEETTVKFSRSILTEAFSPIATSRLKLKWTEAGKPFLFEGVADDDSVVDNVFVLAVPEV